MGKARQLAERDIPQIIELNSRLFPGSAGLSYDIQEKLFRGICFENPWNDGDIRSLVYEENDGKIVGFLGVVPRKMTLNGRELRVAVCQHMMVDRAALASIQLFKKMMEGPQDYSMADMSVEVTRKLWERLGGVTSLLHSIYWIGPLRPASFALSMLKKKNSLALMARLMSPLSHVMDTVTTGIFGSPFNQTNSDLTEGELTPEIFLECFPRFAGDVLLKPSYDLRSLSWLFERLSQEKRFGTFKKIFVRNAENEILGWYLYNLKPGGRSEVLQIAATQQSVQQVLDHLFRHAWEHGSIELSGRIVPKFMRAFADKWCLFSPGRNWMLIHSRDPEIVQTIYRGDAFLSRLEGDLWFF